MPLHSPPPPPTSAAGMTLIGAWKNLVLVVVLVLESKGFYFTVNYRVIADLSRSFSCPILRENWMHGMHDIQLTWKGECLAKACYVTSATFTSFQPQPPTGILSSLSWAVCMCFSFTRIPRLLQVLVGKFLFYYPYFYTTIVLRQFMTILKALKLFKDGSMKIKIRLLQTLIFRQQIVFISF